MVRGTIGAEQTVGAVTVTGFFGHLGAVPQVARLYELGGVGPAHADSPHWKFRGAGAVGLFRRVDAAAELQAPWGVRTFEAVRSCLRALEQAWSRDLKGHSLGMVQVAVSVGISHPAPRHWPAGRRELRGTELL